MIPTIHDPESEEEWAFIGAMFSEYDFVIAKKAISKALTSEEEIKKIIKAPYAQLKIIIQKESELNLQEQNKQIESQTKYYTVDLNKKMMIAYNRLTGEHEAIYDRPMNELEEDFYINNLMTDEEYQWYSHKTDVKPKLVRYNQQTRKWEKNGIENPYRD